MTDRDDSGQFQPVLPSAMRAAPKPVPTFDELFQAHAAFVWRTLVHFGLDEAAAEDGTQEVFVVVHRRLGDYDPSRSARSWLWGIARRVASAYKRGERRHERKLAVVPAPPPEPEPADAVQAREAERMVETFLAELKPGLRQVFVLADIEGATAPEIAEATGLKLNTVYSRLRLARRRFERTLARQRARTKGEQR